MCMHMYVQVCADRYACMCGDHRLMWRLFLDCSFTFSFEAGSLSQTQSLPIQDPPSLPPEPGITGQPMCTPSNIYVGLGNPNSGPPTC